MKFVNAKIYKPDVRKFGEDAIYFISADGYDWYESYSKFTLRYKLCIEPVTNIVRSVSEDAGRLYPDGFTIVEVDSLPDDFSIDGSWEYVDGEVTKRLLTNEELISQAEQKKQNLLLLASRAIEPLQDAVDLGISTQDERENLLAWKKFRVDVNRIDVSSSADIAWPKQPE